VNAPIASLEAITVDRDGTRFPIKVEIGTPYLSKREPDTWRCSVSIEPLHKSLHDIAGGDAFQALCLASRMAIDLLRSFVDNGGRLTYNGDNDVPLDAYILRPSKQ
jgi:hypothetical protein